MTIEQLKTFIKVVELGSFSRAAREVNLSQPSVSCHIMALEQELGARLFDRKGKRIVLTRPGEVLLRYARDLEALERAAKQAVNEVLDIKQGEIRLGSSNIPGSYILLPLIQRFTNEHPRVRIFSRIGDTESITREVLEGTSDLGVVGNKGNNDQLLYDDFVEDTMVLALNAGNPMAERPVITLEELRTIPFIIREEGSGSRKTIEDILAKKGIGLNDLNVVAQLGNTEAIKEGIKAGLGASILSLCAITDEVRFGLIRHVSIEDCAFKRLFYIIAARTRSVLPVVNLFKNFLLEKGVRHLFSLPK